MCKKQYYSSAFNFYVSNKRYIIRTWDFSSGILHTWRCIYSYFISLYEWNCLKLYNCINLWNDDISRRWCNKRKTYNVLKLSNSRKERRKLKNVQYGLTMVMLKLCQRRDANGTYESINVSDTFGLRHCGMDGRRRASWVHNAMSGQPHKRCLRRTPS